MNSATPRRRAARYRRSSPLTLCVFPSDTLASSLRKGEVKERYFNPCNLFGKIQVVSLASSDIDPSKVRRMFGNANVTLSSIGPKSIFGRLFCRLSPELYYLAKLKQFIGLVHEINPSVIRTYDPLLQGFIATYVGNKLRIPTVISVHGIWTQEKAILPRRIFFWTYRNPIKSFSDFLAIINVQILGKMLERYSLKSASAVFCAYDFPREYVEKHRHSRVTTIYNRVDTRRFKPVRRLRTQARTVIHVGRLVYEKSPENLIKAIKGLPVKLIIVGNGELRQYLNRLVGKLQVDTKVQFVYHFDHELIHRLYAKADIFVMCMKIGGVSIPILEAMASGLPVLFTRGIYERKKEVVEGVGVNVRDDASDIAKALSILINDRNLRERLGRKARRKIVSLNGERMERLEAALYKKLMKRLS